MSETPKPLRALVEGWRKIIRECPEEYRKQWKDSFETAGTCARELEAVLDQWEAELGEFVQSIDAAWVRQHILGVRGEP